MLCRLVEAGNALSGISFPKWFWVNTDPGDSPCKALELKQPGLLPALSVGTGQPHVASAAIADLLAPLPEKPPSLPLLVPAV